MCTMVRSVCAQSHLASFFRSRGVIRIPLVAFMSAMVFTLVIVVALWLR
jgi:hypothetical protein